MNLYGITWGKDKAYTDLQIHQDAYVKYVQSFICQ